jgi:hypothetical protein
MFYKVEYKGNYTLCQVPFTFSKVDTTSEASSNAMQRRVLHAGIRLSQSRLTFSKALTIGWGTGFRSSPFWAAKPHKIPARCEAAGGGSADFEKAMHEGRGWHVESQQDV